MHLTFWQPIPSFHQEAFLNALAAADWVDSVTLKFEAELSESRKASGWAEGRFRGVRLEQMIPGELPQDDMNHVHIFTGLNSHKWVWRSFWMLPAVTQCACYAYAEAPECVGWKGMLRSLKYRVAGWRTRSRLDGVLAIGDLGVDFYTKAFAGKVPVHRFAYYSHSREALPILKYVEPPAKTVRFLYVGQLIHRKGVDRLLQAFARVSSQLSDRWILDLVGHGAELTKLQSMAKSLSIEGQVNWHMPVPQHKLESFYRSADHLCLPSRWDGWGVTVNEALCYGCDVMTSQNCGSSVVAEPSARFPEEIHEWRALLESKITAGPLSLEERRRNQARSSELCGETGAQVLKGILNGQRT